MCSPASPEDDMVTANFDATVDLEDLALPEVPDGPFQVAAIALDVSGTCNLACRYCAEAATQPQRRSMSIEELEAAWNLMFPDGHPRAGSSIRLGSGEPLLAFRLLRQLGALIEEHGGSAAEGRPNVFLTTNGTLATRGVRDWLVNSGWHVKISLDGPPHIHDRWRVDRKGSGTWDKVAEAAVDLAERMSTRFSVTAVLCRGNDPAEVFEDIARLGTRRIELVPAAHDDRQIVPDDDDVERYHRFLDTYAYRFTTAEDAESIPALVRFEVAVRRAMGYDLQSVPCGAGRNFLGAGPDGTLYPCFRFVGLQQYRLGSLTTGLDDEAVEAFASGAGRPVHQRRSCSSCWAAPLCGGPCFACAETFGGAGGEPLPVHCSYVKADADRALWLVHRLRKQDPERLLTFLPRVRSAFRLSPHLN